MASPKVPDRFRVASAFWVWLRESGLAADELFRQSKLPVALYSAERTVVSTAQFFALWRSIAELRPQPDVGLRLARELDIGHLPPSSLVAYYAQNYRDALIRLARFKRLCLPEEMRLLERKDECVVELVWVHAKEETPPLLTDAAFASIVELGRRGTRLPLTPRRVELTRPCEPAGVHEAFFGCRVQFRAPRNVLVLKADDLGRPFTTHNPELLEMLHPSLMNALSNQNAAASVREQVKWTLKRLLAGSRPDLVAVARELGVSSRTLQRRITHEGATFQQLLVDARKELVQHYLREPSIEMAEIAYLVGYEDPNSFYRAFRSWEGMTPSEWRASNASAIQQA